MNPIHDIRRHYRTPWTSVSLHSSWLCPENCTAKDRIKFLPIGRQRTLFNRILRFTSAMYRTIDRRFIAERRNEKISQFLKLLNHQPKTFQCLARQASMNNYDHFLSSLEQLEVERPHAH